MTAKGVKSKANDGLARETEFYSNTLSCVEDALNKLNESGTKWNRPRDYYVEMVKTDKHMARVKGALLQRKKEKLK
eukprot:UN07445